MPFSGKYRQPIRGVFGRCLHQNCKHRAKACGYCTDHCGCGAPEDR